MLAHYGLSLSNPADLALLTSLIGSPQAAARGFYPAYTRMPTTQTVAQNLRRSPQFGAPGAVDLGPPIGKTWYDSLQTKVTKRFSHGLQMQASFVWSTADVLGTGAEAGNITTLAGIPIYNDVTTTGSTSSSTNPATPSNNIRRSVYRRLRLHRNDRRSRRAAALGPNRRGLYVLTGRA
jgi:hypothetical protein